VTPSRREVVEQFVPNSPLARHLGIELVEAGEDRARLRMPFKPELVTVGDVVHGGAISALLDTAGMVASWSNDVEPETLDGATVSMSVQFAAPARGCDLIADAVVSRRGRSLCFVDVRVADPDGTVVASGQMVHRYG
jgi:uncharacterized protein (TIGR00369 family)